MIALAYSCGLLLLFCALQVVSLHIATKLIDLPTASWKRAVLVSALVVFLGYVVIIAMGTVGGGLPAKHLLFLKLGAAGALFALTLVLYAVAYRPSGTQIWGFVVLQVVLTGAGESIAFFSKRYVFEAYKIPTNAMAPTICGHRWEASCPKCGGIMTITVYDDEDEFREREEPQLQCVRCRHKVRKSEISAVEKFDDRVLVEKLRGWGRWDLVVFKYPEEPRQNYVKRVVGLPGEEIVIRDGFVFANGVKLETPANYADLHYTARPAEGDTDFGMHSYDREPLWGDPKRPIKLAADEYFVLGDNTEASLDGRFWGPVKHEAVIGIVTCIYWPPPRWKIFK